MKKAYILIYIVIIIALLFMIVVSITDRLDNNNINKVYQIENTKLRYDYESIGHETLVRLKNEGYFSDTLHKITNKAGKETFKFSIDNSKLERVEAWLIYDKNNVILRIGAPNDPYNVEAIIKPYNEIYAKINNGLAIYDSEWEKLFSSGLLDEYQPGYLELNDLTIGSEGNSLYYSENYKEDLEEISEEKDLPEILHDQHLSDINESQDDNTLGQDVSSSAMSQELKEVQDDISDKDPSISEDSEELNLTNEDIEITEEFPSDTEHLIEKEAEKSLEEDSKNPIIKENDIIESPAVEKHPIAKEKTSLVLGPRIRYNSKEKIKTRGIMYISDQTILETNIDHTGIIVIIETPQKSEYSINLTGALLINEDLDRSGININLKNNELITISTLSVYKDFYDPIIDSFTIR